MRRRNCDRSVCCQQAVVRLSCFISSGASFSGGPMPPRPQVATAGLRWLWLSDGLPWWAATANRLATRDSNATSPCAKLFHSDSERCLCPSPWSRTLLVGLSIAETLACLAASTQRFFAGRSHLRRVDRVVPHPRFARLECLGSTLVDCCDSAHNVDSGFERRQHARPAALAS